MSSRDNFNNDDEQKRSPENRKKSPRPFGASELAVEDIPDQPTRSSRTDASQREAPEKEKDVGEPHHKQFGAEHASVEGSNRTNGAPSSKHASAVVAPMRPIPFEETKEELVEPLMNNLEEVHTPLPGAERVGGFADHSRQAMNDNDTLVIGENENYDDTVRARSTTDVVAQAQLVDDPVVAAEVGADRTGELNEVRQQLNQSETNKRRMWIGFGIGVVLVVAIIGALSYLLVGERGNGNEGSIAEAAPDPATASTQIPTLPPATVVPSPPGQNPTRSSQTPNPTTSPTSDPTISPTSNPTTLPTSDPTTSPTSNPTTSPTSNPTTSPTSNPTAAPTTKPTTAPTEMPTEASTEISGELNYHEKPFIKWSTTLAGTALMEPGNGFVRVGSTLYATNGDGTVSAFDASTGETKFSYTPAATDETMVTRCYGEVFYAESDALGSFIVVGVSQLPANGDVTLMTSFVYALDALTGDV